MCPLRFDSYDPGPFYDELFEGAGRPRPGARHLVERIDSMEAGELRRRQKTAEAALFLTGVTFNVYGDAQAEEKIFPFDIVPRIIEMADWRCIEKGLEQRIRALNCFLGDIYHDQKILILK